MRPRIGREYSRPTSRAFSSRDDSFEEGVPAATGGCGVVVLDSPAGDLLQGSFRLVKPFGRFIEVGERVINDDKFYS